MRPTMNLQFYYLVLVAFCCFSFEFQVVDSINEAVFECIKVHHLVSSSLSSINASFANGKCGLKCAIGDVALAVDMINDGQHCPEDMAGICHVGKCVGGQEDALRQCEIEHSMDFHSVKIDPSTAFTNDQCMLRCFLGGVQLSANPKHEDSPCPTNSNGVCRSGVCVATNSVSNVTETPPTTQIPQITTIQPTTITQPSIDTFSPSKMKLLNITLESTLSLNQRLDLDYHKNKNSIATQALCSFYGNPTNQHSNVYYNPQTINEVPNSLNQDSYISIYLYDSEIYLAHQNVDLYPLFVRFYQNHKLAYGENENFVNKITIYRAANLNEKLLDIGLCFTIVFSKV